MLFLASPLPTSARLEFLTASSYLRKLTPEE